MMNKEVAEGLKKDFETLVAGEPFFGTVTHRTRPIFIQKWKKLLDAKGIKGGRYIDDLLKAMGK